MKYGYCRVSTFMQGEGNSIDVQREALIRAGAEKIYTDMMTGKTMDRPEFCKLMKCIKEGDTFIVKDMTRFARTTIQGAQIINEMIEKGIVVNVLNIGIMDNTPANKLVRNLLLSIAEFERDMIVQRTQEGKAIAKLNPNFKEGRPRKFSKEQREHALELLENKSYREVESMTGISKSTLQRLRREQKENN